MREREREGCRERKREREQEKNRERYVLECEGLVETTRRWTTWSQSCHEK